MKETEYRLKIKDLPEYERPYEKLIKHGAGGLSDAELLAIIIKTGTKNDTSIGVAQRLLKLDDTGQGPSFLDDMTTEEMMQVKGIGMVKAITIKAVLEFAKRVSSGSNGDKTIIKSPEDVSRLLMQEMRYLKQEHFKIIMLNTKNHVLKFHEIAVGGLNISSVEPREIFRQPLKKSCAAIILVHNHPSGEPEPSMEDIEVTKRITRAGNLLGIDVLDHIVIGDGRYISLKGKGLI